MATILVREGSVGAKPWKQIMVVTDRRVAIVDMVPTLLAGWNIGKITIQGESEWPNMTEGQIVSWKFNNDDGLTSKASGFSAEFTAKLLAAVGVK